MDPEPDEEAAALVGDLIQAARVPAKRRPFAVKPTVERLAALAYEHGLLPETLRDLVCDVLAVPGGQLDQASLGLLIRNLYPVTAAAGAASPSAAPSQHPVDDAVVLAAVGCLGQGQLKPALPVQALLLRWLVLVYPMLASPAVLSRAYAVLFNLLDTAGIRPQLCHLLALITRRRHVRPFRIQAILQLSRQTGHDPHLIGLLRVYKNYYPEVIVGDATRGRASPFKHPDPQWRAHLEDIQLARQQMRRAELEGGDGGRRGGHASDGAAAAASALHSGFRVRRADARVHGGKGRRLVVPSVHTSRAQEESVTLEEIDSAESLVQHLDRIELPNQLVAVLADPLLQKLLLLRPSAEAAARVEHWIDACIASAASRDGDSGELLDLLDVVHDYVTSTRTFPPVLHRFFTQLLVRWDGRDKRALILEALSYAPVSDFQETYKTTFGPLEAKLLDNSVDSQLALLSFYRLVLQHWAVVLANADDEAVVSAAALPAFVEHVNGLVLAVLQNAALGDGTTGAAGTRGAPTLAALAVLAFYEELMAVLAQRRRDVLALVQEVIPPPAVVYTLHFQQSAAVVSRLYAVLAAYKQALEAAMQLRAQRSSLGGSNSLVGDADEPQQPQQQPQLLPPLTGPERARVNLFNGFLMDVCNCLWRSRAFSALDTNALGCCVPAPVVTRLAAYVQTLDRDLQLPAAFSLSHSPTLCLQAISYLRMLEDEALDGGAGRPLVLLQRRHAGPVTQSALAQLAGAGGLRLSWQAYRVGLLRYLEQRGLGGVSALMHNTMKNLMSGRAST